jgi:glycine/D-amino acid oxidase-like deaminating enzyme
MKLRALMSPLSYTLSSTTTDTTTETAVVSPPKFTIKPRKGQFVVFRPKPYLLTTESKNTATRIATTVTPASSSATTSASLEWHAPSLIIEPVPTLRTKGVILWQTVYGTVVVGPTATDQESKHDRCTDLDTLEKLVAYGHKVVPGLKHWEVIGSYSGLRPATEHRYCCSCPLKSSPVKFNYSA